MRKLWLVVALVCAAGMSAVAQPHNPQYESATIVAVSKLPATHASSGSADAPIASEVDRYKVSIRVDDTVYVCRYESQSDLDLAWIRGRDVLVRIKGNTMYVKKATGKEAQASIVSRIKAPAL